VRAAFALRERGYQGDVTLISGEPYLPYERPPLSKGALPVQKPIRQQIDYSEARINLCLGRQIKMLDHDRSMVLAHDGTTWAYQKLLLATGARSRLLPGMEAATTLRSFDDAAAIFGRLCPGTRLAIIGGGFIGLELAAAGRGLGVQVTVIEAASRLMARAVPPEIAAIVEARHRTEGVHLRLGAQVTALHQTGVATDDGTLLEADLVVAGVGAVPNTELAQEAGLSIDNGIKVDGRFRTSVSNVFAAGDCCSVPHQGGRLRLESWRIAQEQGAHAAAAMLGEVDDFAKVPWFWSDQYDLGLQVAGLMTADAETTVRHLGDGVCIAFQHSTDGRLLCAAGVGKGNRIAKDIRLAEMLITCGASPPPAKLADASINLKTLLKAA
jgi:3-phenylpropionate/trans-cinnamate dioxygenase ferredoxin reductase subunit